MKILEIPKRVAFTKLHKFGARKQYGVFMRVKYFDFPDHRIHKKQDLLRVRELTFLPGKKKKIEIVYKICKGVKNGCKVFDELEFETQGNGAFHQIGKFFSQLGFVQTVYFEKRRTLFSYKKWKFEFDEYPEIPPLLEIEAEDEKSVYRAVSLLGLEKYEKTPETIQHLLKRKYPRVSLNGLVF